jgi:hypothetical protein
MLIDWEDGGSAEVLSLQVDAISVRSTRSSPPGSRLVGFVMVQVPGTSSTGGFALRMKVHSSKREGEARFVLVGRLLDATRELRACITAGLKPQSEATKDPA